MNNKPMDIIFSLQSESSFPVILDCETLLLPSSLIEKIHPLGLGIRDLHAFSHLNPNNIEMLFSEILFVYFPQQQQWRFMGASINYFDGDFIEELGSSIFRSDPTMDIEAPWPCICTFCETALCSSFGRIVPPFVRLAVFSQEETASIWVPLLSFQYETMEWEHDILPFSRPA